MGEVALGQRQLVELLAESPGLPLCCRIACSSSASRSLEGGARLRLRHLGAAAPGVLGLEVALAGRATGDVQGPAADLLGALAEAGPVAALEDELRLPDRLVALPHRPLGIERGRHDA